MRLLCWNIKHGGGSRWQRIVDAIAKHEPDIIVLPEYRHNKSGACIRQHLEELGLVHQFASVSVPKKNGVLIASRFEFEQLALPELP